MRLPNTIYASKKPKEVDIQRAILQYLKLKNVFHFRVNTGGIMRQGKWTPSPNTTKGVSDIVAIKYDHESALGRFIAIEVKRPGGKLSDDQKIFRDNVIYAGGLYLVAYCVGDVKEVFG